MERRPPRDQGAFDRDADPPVDGMPDDDEIEYDAEIAGEPDRPRPAGHLFRAAIALAFIVLLFAIPDLTSAPDRSGLTAYRGQIVDIDVATTPNPAQGFEPNVRVRLSEGPQEGQVVEAYLEGPGGLLDTSGYHPGDDVVVTFSRTPDGQEYIAVSDRWRLPQLGVLTALFAATVILIGGWRGLRALIALGLTIAVVLRVLLPLLIEGVSPIPLAVAAATGVTITTIVLTEGWSRASVAAILGTATALSLTGLLGAAVTQIGGFTGAAASDLIFLQTTSGAGLDLRGIILAAFILGSVGVLDDVTVTQAAFIDEVGMRAGLRGRALFASALDVGRSHIAATINTLFLAYVGATLPLLVVLIVSQQPSALVLNGEVIAIEIVRTMVGSIGIVAAVPITSAIATLLVGAADRRRAELSAWSAAAEDDQEAGPWAEAAPPRRPRFGRPRLTDPLPALVGGLIVVGASTALVAALIGPLGPGTSGATIPSPRPSTSPAGSSPAVSAAPSAIASSPAGSSPAGSPAASSAGSVTPSAAASATPAATAPAPSPGPSDDVVPLAVEGEPVDVLDADGRLGAVTLLEWETVVEDGATMLHARVSYEADRPWAVGPDSWTVLAATGEEAAAIPDTRSPSLEPRTLEPGEVVDGWITAPMPDAGAGVFLVYRSPSGAPQFAIVLQ